MSIHLSARGPFTDGALPVAPPYHTLCRPGTLSSDRKLDQGIGAKASERRCATNGGSCRGVVRQKADVAPGQSRLLWG